MSGHTDLQQLLNGLEPVMAEPEYGFCVVAPGSSIPWEQVLASFRESEGLSLVTEFALARRLSDTLDGPFRCISLSIHSSLHAVGLSAAISGILAEHGISCNIIAAFHHDHVLVPSRQAAQALALIRSLRCS